MQVCERYLIDLYGWTFLGMLRREDGQWMARYLCTDGGERRCFVVCLARHRPTLLTGYPADVTVMRGTNEMPEVVIVRRVKARQRRQQQQSPSLRRHLWRDAGRVPAADVGEGERSGV